MRTLIVIPMIHGEQDMGSLLGQVKHEYVRRYGDEKWSEHLQSIDSVWTGIRQLITLLDLPYARVRLYQDGLPLCGKEIDIVRDVAAHGSKNHQLLLELVERGARLMGTEDPRLLLEEYQFHKDALQGGSPVPAQSREQQSRRLLSERDSFIAGHIDQTLAPGEIGLLFLGIAHCVEPLLRADILVKHLLPPVGERPGQ
ncbi:MAG: hypothetical protein ACT4NV_02710 [Rhodoferax sp.]